VGLNGANDMTGKLTILNAGQLAIPGLGDYGGFCNGNRKF
jgi:hypothetical protein